MPRDGLAIIESKSKVRYSRSRAIEPRASTNAPLSTSTPSNSFEIQQLAASLEDKMDIRMSRLEKMISTTPATVKAVEEVCVTCGANHNFNNCPLTRGGNDFPVFHDNIHQFQQTTAVGNFVQRNPPNLANQMRPPGFNQPNVQSNQSRYQGNNFNSNQNNQGAVYQAPPYQPPTNQPLVNQALPPVSQIQGVSKTDFESYAKANDANMNNLQMKLDNFQRNQNDFQRVYNDSQKKQDDFQNMMLSFMQNYHSNTASSSNSGTLPSQTVTNPREHVNAITTRSGKTLEGPSTPLVPTPVVSIPSKEPEQNPETSTEKVQNPNLENTAHVPPPEEEDSIFIEIPKPKAKKTINVETQDLNSPKPTSYQPKLPYPERMKVRENDKPSAQHSRFLKIKLEAGALTSYSIDHSSDPLPNRSLRHPMGIAEDVVVRVDGFTFLADFVVVNFVPDPRVPVILGRPFLRTAKALIDLYEETLNLRVGKEELVYYVDKSEKNEEKKYVHAISVIDFSKDDPFSGSTTIPSDVPFPSSSLMKTSDSTFEKFTDEFTLSNSLPPGNDVSIHKKDIHGETFSNPLFEFDDSFKSSDVNPLFKENNKDVEIKSSPLHINYTGQDVFTKLILKENSIHRELILPSSHP
ncbi:reverse transcriptase domain-containing protein [Tanacetum coccineum]